MDYKIFSILFLILALYSTLNLSCRMKGLERSNLNTHTRPMRLPSRLGKRRGNLIFLIAKLFDQYKEVKSTQNHCNEKKRYTTSFSSYILPMFKKGFHSGSKDPGISGMRNFLGKRTGSRDKIFQRFLHISRRIWNFFSKFLLNV
jgi:hypothetical protein